MPKQSLQNSAAQSAHIKADTRLALVGGITVLFSVAAFAAGLLGALPSATSTVLVLLGMGVALKVTWIYVARSSSSASRARTTAMLSNTGLAIAAITVIAAVPRLTKTSGVALLLADLLAQLWTMAILTAAAGPVRTLGWRAFAGAFLVGFLGLTGMARVIGRPLILMLGTSSVLAAGIWVPLTEELCKMLPVILILVLALRRSDTRPSLLDLVLVGAWAAAGFAVNENASYGRGGFSLVASPFVSILFPGTMKGMAYGWTVAQTGHLVHTALIALGVGFAFLYRRRLQRFWIVPAIAVAAALIEHCSQNSITTGGLNKIVAEFLLAITLGGRLSALLLVAGIVYVVAFEWRALGGALGPRAWLALTSSEMQRRGALLASLQTGVAHSAVGVRERTAA
jgi:RsiW-degrading membrane proteinase PrsW (M82 family)